MKCTVRLNFCRFQFVVAQWRSPSGLLAGPFIHGPLIYSLYTPGSCSAKQPAGFDSLSIMQAIMALDFEAPIFFSQLVPPSHVTKKVPKNPKIGAGRASLHTPSSNKPF
jgi:hypothetical protein